MGSGCDAIIIMGQSIYSHYHTFFKKKLYICDYKKTSAKIERKP